MCLRRRLSLLCGTGRGEWIWGETGGIGDFERVEIDALNIRLLQCEEVSSIWQIDRREVVEKHLLPA